MSLCPILHPPGRGTPPWRWCPLRGDGRMAPRTRGAVRTHGHTDTPTPVFPTARTPDPVKRGVNRKASSCPQNAWHRAAGPRAQRPRSKRGVPQQRGAARTGARRRSAPGAGGDGRGTGGLGALGSSRCPGRRLEPTRRLRRKRPSTAALLRALLPGQAGQSPPCLAPCPSQGAHDDFCHQRFVSPN